MRTYVATPKTVDSRWHVIDANDQSQRPLCRSTSERIEQVAAEREYLVGML